MRTLKTALFWLCSSLLLVAAVLFIGLVILCNQWVDFMTAWSAGQEPELERSTSEP